MMHRKGTSPLIWLSLLVIILYGFVIWTHIRWSNQAMSLMEGGIEQYLVEKAKYFTAMFKESYESPALTYSLMDVVKDLASHGGVTSEFITNRGTYEAGGKYYVNDVEVDIEGKKLECMRVERETHGIWPSTHEDYILYWIQAEGTGIEKFRPFAYYSDENAFIGDEDYTIRFETDYDRPVGEVAVVLYFLKDGYVEIKSGDKVIKRVENTGVYVIDGSDIKNNELVFRGSSKNVALLRGVVASIYRDKNTIGSVATCARDMLEELMWSYIRPVLNLSSYYGMEIRNSYPNVSFDPSVYYVHGSVWMPKGANITKYFKDGSVMVRVHTNMFAESNISVRYGLLIKYANWFVENVEGILLSRIWEMSNDNYEDSYIASETEGTEHCDSGGNIPKASCPHDSTNVPKTRNVKNDIVSLLNTISSELTQNSEEGIRWRLELVDSDNNFDNNFHDIQYSYIYRWADTSVYCDASCNHDCPGSCSDSTSGNLNGCEAYYYHRYVFGPLVIKLEISDEKYRVFDVSKNDWEPLTLVVYLEIMVDDDLCRFRNVYYRCSAICGYTHGTYCGISNTNPYGNPVNLKPPESK